MNRIEYLACKFAIRNKKELPLSYENLLNIARKKQWYISTYAESRKLFEKYSLSEYAAKHKGFCYLTEEAKIIFISNKLSYNDKRRVLAHEFGHIVLDHYCIGKIGFGEKGDYNKLEHEANIFAYCLIAPYSEEIAMYKHYNLFKFKCWLRKHLISISLTTVLIAAFSVLILKA